MRTCNEVFQNHALIDKFCPSTLGRRFTIQAFGRRVVLQAFGRQVVSQSDFYTDRSPEAIALRLTQSLPVASFVMKTSPRGELRFAFMSEPWLRMNALTAEQVTEQPLLPFERIHPHDQPAFWQIARRARREFQPLHWEGRLKVDGRTLWCTMTATPYRLPDDDSIAWEGMQIDVSRRHEMERQLRASEARWRKTLDHVPTPVLCAHMHERIVPFFVNRAFTQTFGYSLAELLDTGRWVCRAYPDPEYRASVQKRWKLLVKQLRSNPAAVESQEIRLHSRDGEARDALVAGSLVDDMLLVSFTDLTERKRIEALHQHRARHDVLTGLPNRTVLDEAVAEAMIEGEPFALLFLDLDQFKQVNDRFGHSVGDRVLQGVAQRLRMAVRSGDIPIRVGGDELVVLARQVATREAANGVASRLHRALQAPFAVEDRLLPVSASIGVALFPQDGSSLDTLMQHADAAMYRSKAGGTRSAAGSGRGSGAISSASSVDPG